MATHQSTKTARFWGFRNDLMAEGIDSLSPIVSLNRIGFPYVFPPPPLISRVMDKINQAKLTEPILIAPWWPSKPWFPRLINMTTDLRRLPLGNKLVRDLSNMEDKIDTRKLRLVAFKLSGVDFRSNDTKKLRLLAFKLSAAKDLFGYRYLPLI